MKTLGIYFHVPFCGKKCPYCDFYSTAYNRSSAEAYVDAVIRNIQHFSDRAANVDTVYFGGGTPSLMTAEHISRILDSAAANFNIESDAEITLEANPNTLTPEKLLALRHSGVNRLSIGIQSMLDDELAVLGRSHSAERAKRAVLSAADAGFGNISCDLMIALPEQTPEKLTQSIERLNALPIQHISAYILKIEDGTPFAQSGVEKSLPDDEMTAQLYLHTVKLLGEYGFMQYEVSNFAKEGFHSRHNCRYWKCEDYLGIGPAAHSCYKGKRTAVPDDLGSFISSDFQQSIVTDDSPCSFEEQALLRLRLTEGLDLRRFPQQRPDVEKQIPPLEKAGYVRFDGNVVSLTPQGFLVSNSVIERLVF